MLSLFWGGFKGGMIEVGRRIGRLISLALERYALVNTDWFLVFLWMDLT